MSRTDFEWQVSHIIILSFHHPSSTVNPVFLSLTFIALGSFHFPNHFLVDSPLWDNSPLPYTAIIIRDWLTDQEYLFLLWMENLLPFILFSLSLSPQENLLCCSSSNLSSYFHFFETRCCYWWWGMEKEERMSRIAMPTGTGFVLSLSSSFCVHFQACLNFLFEFEKNKRRVQLFPFPLSQSEFLLLLLVSRPFDRRMDGMRIKGWEVKERGWVKGSAGAQLFDGHHWEGKRNHSNWPTDHILFFPLLLLFFSPLHLFSWQGDWTRSRREREGKGKGEEEGGRVEFWLCSLISLQHLSLFLSFPFNFFSFQISQVGKNKKMKEHFLLSSLTPR